MRITLKNAAKLQHFFHTHNNCQHFCSIYAILSVRFCIHMTIAIRLTKWHKLRFFHNKQHAKTKNKQKLQINMSKHLTLAYYLIYHLRCSTKTPGKVRATHK